MRALVIAAVVLATAAGCGGGSSAPTNPVPIKNASPEFGQQVSQVCEGTYWRIKRLTTHPRPHVDYVSVIDHEVNRLHRLRAPAREQPAYQQFIAQLTTIESLAANAVTSASFSGFEEALKAEDAPVRLTAALARELRAPGCLDEFLGRGWRKRGHTLS